jgi:hypothetical protein
LMLIIIFLSSQQISIPVDLAVERSSPTTIASEGVIKTDDYQKYC